MVGDWKVNRFEIEIRKSRNLLRVSAFFIGKFVMGVGGF